jgi:hypothetical protein
VLYPGRRVLVEFPGAAKWLLMHGPAFRGVVTMIDDGIGALRRAGVDEPALVYSMIFNTAMLTISMNDDRLEQADDGPRDHRTMLASFLPLRSEGGGIAALIDELMVPLSGDPSRADALSERYYRTVIEALMAGVGTRSGT